MIGFRRNAENWLAACLLEDRNRWFLWTPVLFAVGTALYFNLTWHPDPIWLFLPIIPLLFLLFPFLRHRQVSLVTILTFLVFASGFSGAALRSFLVEAPVLGKKTVSTLTGTVLSKSANDRKTRLVLESLVFEKPTIPALRKIRLTVRNDISSIEPGDRVTVKAVLLPPPPPAYPGAYDFQRDAFFKQIGAVGYSIGPFTTEKAALEFSVQRLSAFLRDRVNRYVLDNSAPEVAGFSIAIMSGDKGMLSKDQLDDMRNSGLAHLLAISGLHMGMVGGLIFFTVRLLGSLYPRLALNYPIKKGAAVISLVGLAGYLLVSGMSVSALRAFLMISMVFLAICFDRTALSLRNLAFAALLILMFLPESLLTASFQMSFSAVFCLIAVYEKYGNRLIVKAGEAGPIKRGLYYLTGIIVTSLIASAATTPFAIYHFGQFSLLGVLANLVAVPLMGLWVMPWTLVAFAIMPFAETTFALDLAGNGITLILWIAAQVTNLPAAFFKTGTYPSSFLVGIVLAGLWLLIWKSPLKWGAVAFILAGGVGLFTAQPPDILFARSGNLYLINDAEAGPLVSTLRADRFERERWALLYGAQKPKKISKAELGNLTCDDVGCLYDRGNTLIAFAENRYASELDCNRSNILLSRAPVPNSCASPDIVIDRFDLWRKGAHSLYFNGAGEVTVQTVNGIRGDRPWVPVRYREALNR